MLRGQLLDNVFENIKFLTLNNAHYDIFIHTRIPSNPKIITAVKLAKYSIRYYIVLSEMTNVNFAACFRQNKVNGK